MAPEVQRRLGADGEPRSVLRAHHGGIVPFLGGDQLAERVLGDALLLLGQSAHIRGREIIKPIRRERLQTVHCGGKHAGCGRRDDALVRFRAELAALRHERVEIRLRDVRARAQKQRRERDAGIVERGRAVRVYGGRRLIDRVFHRRVMLHCADGLIRGGQQRAEILDLGVELTHARGVLERLFRVALHGDLAPGAHLCALVDIDGDMRL